MKKRIVLVLLGSVLLAMCNTQDDQALQESVVVQENVNTLINQLVAQQQAKGTQAKGTLTTQNIITQTEALAMQDTGFLQLVTPTYTTPQASTIDAIVANSDLVLSNLNISTLAKSYATNLLSIQTLVHLNTLVQTITNDTQLTIAEKSMLLEAANLQQQYIVAGSPGNGDNWDKKRIIGYLQGATQSKANAVLNTVVIQVMTGNQ